MSFITADRIKETTTTTGTGTITLAGAATGFRTFASVMATGDTCYYAIIGATTEWEVGVGLLATSTTLTRNQVIASSNAGSLVTFSAGTKDVFITAPAVNGTSGVGLVTSDNGAYRLLGMNFGHDQVGTGTIATAQNTHDFAILRQYTNRLRIAMPAHDDATGVADMKTIALAALAAGFEVSVGVVVATGSNLTSYNAWKNTEVAALASWASTNRIRNFYIGNEEDWWASQGTIAGGSITASTVRTDVRTLATSIKGTYPELTLLYATADGTIDDWNNDSAGIGDLDGIGVNLYQTSVAAFETRLDALAQAVKLAPALFISEWATENPYPDSMSDNQYRDAIYGRYRAIQKWGLEAYYFTWRLGGGTDWGTMDATGLTHKPGYEEVMGLVKYHTPADMMQSQHRFPNGTVLSENQSEVGVQLNGTFRVLNTSTSIDGYIGNTVNDANLMVEATASGKAAFQVLSSQNDSYVGLTYYANGVLITRIGRNGDSSGLHFYTSDGVGGLAKALTLGDDQSVTTYGPITQLGGPTPHLGKVTAIAAGIVNY